MTGRVLGQSSGDRARLSLLSPAKRPLIQPWARRPQKRIGSHGNRILMPLCFKRVLYARFSPVDVRLGTAGSETHQDADDL